MYVDAYYRRSGEGEMVRVVERVDGQRVYKDYPPDHHFYVNDPNGNYQTIYGNRVRKITPRSYGEKLKAIKSFSSNVRTWESDMDPVFRILENRYRGAEAPKMNVAFFDIETSYDPIHGWSEPSDAFNAITSIAVYLSWLKTMVCLAIPPDGMSPDRAESLGQAAAESTGSHVVIYTTEKDMLSAFMDLVEDADCLVGWNSEGYDIPYTINRIKRILGKHSPNRLCLWDQSPKVREYEFGGKTQQTYDLVGRLSIDYMQLYKKYNYEERQSYALNSIAEIELNETKVQYDGTLDDLYNDDFQKFLEYNIQDTYLLDRLDQKLKFIDLAGTIAHSSCVLFSTTMGAVAVTDQSIVMEAHSRGLIVPDKNRDHRGETRAAGGWVATPKVGYHQWVGSVDLNSLYPSAIRAFNMSSETIVGQIRLDQTREAIAKWEAASKKNTFANWWNDRYNVLEMDDFYEGDPGVMLTVDWEDGTSHTMSARELRALIFDCGNPWGISANGTIFRFDRIGVIPSLLTGWYSGRKTMQRRAADINEVNGGIELSDRLREMFGE